jgi:hypothetical protein
MKNSLIKNGEGIAKKYLGKMPSAALFKISY